MYQNCKFHISHHSEYVFSSLSIYFTLIAIVLNDYDSAFLYNCWFLFIIWGCWYAPFWQEFSVKSLILRWPLRLVGLLFNKICRIDILIYKRKENNMYPTLITLYTEWERWHNPTKACELVMLIIILVIIYIFIFGHLSNTEIFFIDFCSLSCTPYPNVNHRYNL